MPIPRRQSSSSPESASSEDGFEEPWTQTKKWQPGQVFTWCLLLLMVSLVFTHLYIKDEAEPWDEDLVLALDTVEDHLPPASRLKSMLMNAQMPMAMREDAVWDWAIEDLEPVVGGYEKVLLNFADILSDADAAWDSASVVWRHEDLGKDPSWKKVLVIKQAQVFYLKKLGQEARAFSAAIDLAELGVQLAKQEAWPSFVERAIDCQLASARCLAVLLEQTQLQPDQLKQLQEDYQRCEPTLQQFSHAMEGFYGYEKKLLSGPREEEPALPLSAIPAREHVVFFKPNSTLKLFAQSFRELKDGALITPFPLANQMAHRISKPSQGFLRIGNPNWSGEQYFASRMEKYMELPDEYLFARSGHVLVSHLFAFRRYLLEELSVPDNLSQLVPKFLPQKLVDPFTGMEIRHDAEKGLIYSPGRDFDDEGGDADSAPLQDWNEPTVMTGLGVAKLGS